MLYHTLMPIYRSTYVDRLAFMVYDYTDPGAGFQGAKARGILIADEVGGIFVTHTVPSLVDFLGSDRPKFPESELNNGHLITCISLDVETVNELAVMVRHAGAKIFALHIPQLLADVVPTWTDAHWNTEGYKEPSIPLEFLSKQSAIHGFVVVRKPGQKSCLYRTFAKKQNIVLDVYTPGAKAQKNICEKGNYGLVFNVRTIDSISLKIHDENVQYISNRSDQARFAVSTAAHWQTKGRSAPQYWTCTSSLDRDDSSGKGGLLLCIDDYQIWNAFDNLKIKEPECK